MSEVSQFECMATVGRATFTAIATSVLILPLALIVLLQGPSMSPAHAFPTDDFGDGIRVTFDPAVSANISSVVDPSGNMHVVWEDYRSGNGDIYYVKLDAEGDKLTNDAKISNDISPSRNPSVAVDPTDHIYIVWEEFENSSWELLFAKLWYYDGNITFQENGLQVSDSDPANSTEPNIAVEAEGGLALVWTDARDMTAADNNTEIYYKRLDERGYSLTADIRVTRDVGWSAHPRLDIDSANVVHITWYDYRDSDDGIVVNHGVFYRKMTVDGLTATVERRVTFASPSSRPDIAVDTEGNVHIVFDDDRYASFDIFYTLLDNDGITIRDDMNISPKDETESRCPRVELSDSNAIDAVWQDFASGRWAIHYSALAYDGSPVIFDQAITTEVFDNATAPVVMCAKDNNTFIMYIGDVGNTEVFFSRTHRPDPAIYGSDMHLSTSQPLLGTRLWVNATVRNLEGDTIPSLTVRLTIDSTVVNETAVLALAGGSSRVVSFSHVAEAGESTVTVQVDPDDGIRETEDDNNEASAAIVVRIPGVTLVPEQAGVQVPPGDDATFNLTIANDGSHDFEYDMYTSGVPEDWSVATGGSPEGTFLVEAGSTVLTPLVVSVPEGTSPGARMFTVTVECAEDNSVSDTVDLMVDVEQVGNVSVTTSASGGVVEPTMVYTYSFTVGNDGNSNETFVITAEDQRGWGTALSASVLELAPGTPVTVTLTTSVARYDPPGTSNIITLTAQSRNISSNSAQASVICTVGYHREVSLAIVGQTFVNYSVPRDQQVIYTLDVTNHGNDDDIVQFALAGPTSFWSVLETNYALLAPGESATVRLIMTPGTSVLAGIYSFNISATSESDPAVVAALSMSVSVQPYYALSVTVDTDAVYVRPGETAFVNVTIENWGNIADGIDLYMYTEVFNTTVMIINGDEFDLLNDTLPVITLDPMEFIVITVKIFVPSDGGFVGSHELFTDVASASDPTATSTGTFWIIVEESKPWLSLWMILAIAGGVGAGVLVLFLVLRARGARLAEKEDEDRKKMQKKPGVKPAKKPA